jgi:predicted nucleotidyltransferase
MNLERVLREIAERFREREVRYGLTGGYAVAIHGHPRTTVDLDFLVDRADLETIDEILHDMGYEIVYRSENVSQFISSKEELGEIDFIHAFREASMKMLARATPATLFAEGPSVVVLKVEDVIGLKIQAIANAPHRRSHDLADIQNLVEVHRESIDWELIQDYCSLFGMMYVAEKLKAGEWQD